MSQLRVLTASKVGNLRSILVLKHLSKVRPPAILTRGKRAKGGRNNRGVITSRGRGGGSKRNFRRLIINYKPSRDIQKKHRTLLRYRTSILTACSGKTTSVAKVVSLEHDPNRNAVIALLHYASGSKMYMLAPRSIKCGQSITFGCLAARSLGSMRPIYFLPSGSIVHNLELREGKGGQIARAGGTFVKLLVKAGNYVTVTMPSKEVRLIPRECCATLGQVGTIMAGSVTIGKAGRSRWNGRRPQVRGSAQNPNDHPHGGGEGKCPVGRKHPVTPWGKCALGKKTRSKRKRGSELILLRP